MTIDIRPGDWIQIDAPDGVRITRVVKQVINHPAGHMIQFAGGDAYSFEQLIHLHAQKIPRPLRAPYEGIDLELLRQAA